MVYDSFNVLLDSILLDNRGLRASLHSPKSTYYQPSISLVLCWWIQRSLERVLLQYLLLKKKSTYNWTIKVQTGVAQESIVSPNK